MNNRMLFFILAIVHLLPLLIIDLFLINEIDYLDFYLDKVPDKLLEDYIDQLLRWKWLSYPTALIFLFLKTRIVAFILWLVLFLNDKKKSSHFTWRITLLGQLVFVLKAYIMLSVFIFTPDLSLKDLQNFNLLSIANLFEPDSIQVYWSYMFQSLNLFELVYWIIIGYLLAKHLKSPFYEGLRLTLASYIPAFGLWLLTITFLALNNS